jgi:DNA-directed RNA polymerase specialized sigma24 family protein
MSKTGRDPRETATPKEVAAALQDMSRADRVRLEHFARLRAAGLQGLDWEDLLHEAIDRALSGARRWPRSVSLVAFLCGTIRSISGDLWREGKFKSEIPISGAVGHNTGLEVDPPDENPSPEREVIARRVLESIFRLFKNDKDVLAVLQGLGDGSNPEEIQRANGITPKRYASAQKRIRRRMSAAMEERVERY